MGAREPTTRRGMSAIKLGTWHAYGAPLASILFKRMLIDLVPIPTEAGIRIPVRFRTEI
jgi:hypothetical protein